MDFLVVKLLLLQVSLPLGLVLLNAILPTGSRVGLALRSTGVALWLVYLALAGLWLFPPWWTPWAMLALHLLLSVLAWRRSIVRHATYGRMARAGESLAGVALLLGGVLTLASLSAARSAPDAMVALTTPLEPGRYLVLGGGRHVHINPHLATAHDPTKTDWRGQSRAVDLIAIDRLGRRAPGIAPSDPRDYLIFGRLVSSPCDARVLALADGLPDNPVPTVDREARLGNHVWLDCHGDVVLLAHLAEGSITVQVGEEIERGSPLGRVGNSGYSGEPHLHLHVQSALPADAPVAADPLWFSLDGRFPVRNDVLNVRAAQSIDALSPRHAPELLLGTLGGGVGDGLSGGVGAGAGTGAGTGAGIGTGIGVSAVPEAVCADPAVTIEASVAADVRLVCDGAGDAYRFFGRAGLAADLELRIHVRERLDALQDTPVVGRFIVEDGRLEVLSAAAFRARGPFFGLEPDAELYRSVVAHEVAHALTHAGMRALPAGALAMEYIAYVVMLDSLPDALRERWLAHNDVPAYTSHHDMSVMYYWFATGKFATKVWRHYTAMDDGPAFLRAILDGRVLRPSSNVDGI